MAKASEVLDMLIPDGGWYVVGDDYAGIVFVDCEPITEQEFLAGFETFDAWQKNQQKEKAAQRASILERLGLTEDEAKLILD